MRSDVVTAFELKRIAESAAERRCRGCLTHNSYETKDRPARLAARLGAKAIGVLECAQSFARALKTKQLSLVEVIAHS
jgi:hypothetical protein